MRRLPIYFLIDVSESMVGEPVLQVEEGLSTIIQTLKTDPNAIETVWVSVIVFAGQPKTLVPLQEIINFYPPRFPVGSGTSLSRGLGHLMYELRKNIVKTTATQKGDWKPIVFLFTDGVPTDDTQTAIAEWKQNWARTANLVAVSFGSETDTELLYGLTENVLHFRNADAAAYRQFFKWVTDSIKTSSESVETKNAGFELARLEENILQKAEMPKYNPGNRFMDNNFAVFAGKCQNTKRPYLMKYTKAVQPGTFNGLELNTLYYKFTGAYPVDVSYFDLSDPAAKTFKVNTEELAGYPSCPCCGNMTAFAVCACGKVHCIGDEEVSTCPWCGNQGTYTRGGGDFDVNRTQG